MTFRTLFPDHVLFQPFPDCIVIGFLFPALKIGKDPLKGTHHVIPFPAQIIAEIDLFLSAAVKQKILNVFRQIPELGCQHGRHLKMFRNTSEQVIIINNKPVRSPPPAGNRAFADGKIIIDRQFRFHDHERTDPVTLRTCAVRTVERKMPGFQLAETDSAINAGKIFADPFFFPGTLSIKIMVFHKQDQFAVSALQSSFHRVIQTGIFQTWSGHQAIHHSIDLMPFRLGKRIHVIRQFQNFSVNADTDKSVLPDLFQNIFVFPFPSGHKRCEDHHFESFRQTLDFIANRFGRLCSQLFPAFRTVRDPAVSVKQTQIVIDLRNGCNG